MNPDSPPPRSRWSAIGLGAAALAACTACCAGPVLATLGGIGLASALAAIWIPALAVVSVLAVIGAFWLRRRRVRHARRHAGTVVMVGLPGLRTSQPRQRPRRAP